MPLFSALSNSLWSSLGLGPHIPTTGFAMHVSKHGHVWTRTKVSGNNARTLFCVVHKDMSVHYPFHSSELVKLLKMVLEITKLIDNKSKKLFTGQVFEAFTT